MRYQTIIKLPSGLRCQRNPTLVLLLRHSPWVTLVILGAVMMGCGGGSNPVPPSSSQNVMAFMQDAAPDGVVAFGIDVNSAALKAAAGDSVALINSPEHVEVRHLELAPTVAFRGGSTQVNTYTGLALDFSNPQLMLETASGNIVHLDSSSTPSVQLAVSSVTIPLSIVLSASDHVGLMLDFDLRQSISIDAKGNYLINPVVHAATQANSAMPLTLEDALATISATFLNGPTPLSQVPIDSLTGPGSSETQVFQVVLAQTGQMVPVSVDSNTVMDSRFGAVSQLKVGQQITLTADFQPDGTLLAKHIEAGPSNGTSRYQGVVTGVQQSASGYSIDVVVQN